MKNLLFIVAIVLVAIIMLPAITGCTTTGGGSTLTTVAKTVGKVAVTVYKNGGKAMAEQYIDDKVSAGEIDAQQAAILKQAADAGVDVLANLVEDGSTAQTPVKEPEIAKTNSPSASESLP